MRAVMTATGQRTYIIRILRRLEKKLAEEGHHVESDLTGKVCLHISSNIDLRDTLERLYCVDGFEQFAIVLMWLSSRSPVRVNGLDDDMREYEAGLLRQALLRSEFAEAPPGDREGGSPENSLREFSRFIAETRKRLSMGGKFHGFNGDILGRVSDEVSGLREALSYHPDVGRFCDALHRFIDYVQRRSLFSDVRVMNLLDNANLTLQTVVAAGISEERDSLEQTIQLLENPARLFEQLPSEGT